MKSFKISKLEANQRVDKYVKKYLSNAPLSFIYKLFRKKDVKINSHWVKENYIIQEGDEICIYVTDSQIEEFTKEKEIEKIPLSHPIVYEDENILIINKPRGLLVHGDINEKRVTLTNEVLNYLYSKNEYDPKKSNGFTPAPAHRLDRNTSGIVLYAKNLPALQQLEELFLTKELIEKKYVALVFGKLKDELELNYPLLKDENSGLVKVASMKDGAKSALTLVKPIKFCGEYTLVEANLITGRTHQIRVHLSYAGYPIVGDAKYGDFKLNKIFRDKYKFENQFLHAHSIEFKKIGGVLSYLSNKKFIAELPEKENNIISKLF